MAIGWTAGTLSSGVGLAASFAFDLPTGATMVCAFGAGLALAGLAYPFLRGSPAHALRMVCDIAAGEAGPLLIDAVTTQHAFLEGLAASGWTVERPFQRMRFGRATSQGDEPPFAVAGPEYG